MYRVILEQDADGIRRCAASPEAKDGRGKNRLPPAVTGGRKDQLRALFSSSALRKSR